MAVTAQQVKELRELTDCGIMDCKKALIECDGDIEKAKAWLREKGMAKAEKKSARIAAEGAVVAKIADDKKSGVLVEINIETDFAANTDKFKAFTDAVATHILAKKPANIEEQIFQKEAIADIGENTSIRRFVIYEVEGNGAVAAYIHMGGKVGVFVEVTTDDDSVINKPEFADFAKNIGMQVASMRPNWVEEKDVPQGELDKEVEIIKNKALEEGKPEKIIMERIVPGQIKNFYKLNCLVDQEFFRDDDLTISQYIEQSIKAIGANVSIVRFTRFGLGEGIEKKVDDFAEEVRKQAGL